MPNARYDEMFPTRFVDDGPKKPLSHINFGKKTSSGGLSAAKKTQFNAEDAAALARHAKSESDPILSRAMGQQAHRRKDEALSTAREARAKALRRY